MASDVIGLIGSQEGDQVGHVGRGFPATKGDAFHGFLQRLPHRHMVDFAQSAIDLIPHGSEDDSRAIGVDGDLVLGQFLGRGLGQAAYGELGSGVGGQRDEAFVPGDGRGVDDLALGACLTICWAASYVP